MILPKHFAIISACRLGTSHAEHIAAHSELAGRLLDAGFKPRMSAGSGRGVMRTTGFEVAYGYLVPLTEAGFAGEMRSIWAIAKEFQQAAVLLVTAGSVALLTNVSDTTMRVIPAGRWSEVSEAYALTKETYTAIQDQKYGYRYYVAEFDEDTVPTRSTIH